MKARYKQNEFMKKLKEYYKNVYKKDENYHVMPKDRFPVYIIKHLLGIEDDEMYILLNTYDEKYRLRTNLEEEASIRRYCYINGYYRVDDDDHNMLFFREAVEGVDYQCYDEWCEDASLDEYQERAYKAENEKIFPRSVNNENLTVRCDEIERFVIANPELFLPQALDGFDFEKINPINKIIRKENEYTDGYNATGKPFIDLVTKLICEGKSDKEIALELKNRSYSLSIIGAVLHDNPEEALASAKANSTEDRLFSNFATTILRRKL